MNEIDQNLPITLSFQLLAIDLLPKGILSSSAQRKCLILYLGPKEMSNTKQQTGK